MLQKSNIQTINFAQLYKEQKLSSSFQPKSSQEWDEKACKMDENVFKSMYIEEFLEKVDLKNAKTLLDVGCGPGTLSISLAKKLEKVYCLDFSSKMLECVKKNAKKHNINNIYTIHKSFEDTWDDVPKCDILIASRCMEVANLEQTLKKLNSHAKTIYLTYKVGGSFIDKDILNELEREVIPKPDYIYLVNILYSLGIRANVNFIKSEGNRFQAENTDDFIKKIIWSIGELSHKEKKNLELLFKKKYKKKSNIKKYNYWAFLSYKTNTQINK